MSFPSTGVAVTVGYVGATGHGGSAQQAVFRIGGWTELPASGTPTTNAAPDTDPQFGDPLFHVRAFADGWVAIGPTPNAATGPRFPVATGTDYDFVVTKGDRLAWLAA